jgi:hypothetical protein
MPGVAADLSDRNGSSQVDFYPATIGSCLKKEIPARLVFIDWDQPVLEQRKSTASSFHFPFNETQLGLGGSIVVCRGWNVLEGKARIELTPTGDDQDFRVHNLSEE